MFYQHAYRQLLEAIMALEREELVGEKQCFKIRTHYRFFTSLFWLLVEQKEKYGCHILDALRLLKQGVRLDFKYMKKINTLIVGAILEMVLIAFILLIFFYYFSSQFTAWGSVRTIWGSMPIWWLIGGCGFILLLWWGYRFFISDFYYLFKVLFALRIYMEIGTELSSLFALHELQFVLNPHRRSFATIPLYIRDILTQIRVRGEIDREQFNLVIVESWDIYQEAIIRYQQIIQLGKFLILAIFFLGSYLYHLLTIVRNFTF